MSDDQRRDPEVPAKAKRRTFTAAFKAKVLAEYEAAPQGSKGGVLRRYGVGSWHISDWRRAREAGAVAGLEVKRGPKPADGRDKRIAELEAENARLAERARKAEKVIEVQGKVSALLQDLCESASEDKPDRFRRRPVHPRLPDTAWINPPEQEQTDTTEPADVS